MQATNRQWIPEPAGTAWNSRAGIADRLVNHLLSVGWLLASCCSRSDEAGAARLDAAIDEQGCQVPGWNLCASTARPVRPRHLASA
jgi:hypothetical protein